MITPRVLFIIITYPNTKEFIHSPGEIIHKRKSSQNRVIRSSLYKCTGTIIAKAAPKRVREGLKADTMLNWFLRNESELPGKKGGKRYFWAKKKMCKDTEA